MTTIFAFPDIETTGLDPDDDAILELAWFLTDENFSQLTSDRTFLINHGQEWPGVHASLMANEVVRNMHEASGLLADLQTGEAHTLDRTVMHFCDDVEAAAHLMEKELSEVTVHFAGLSVGFDREFLKRSHSSWNLLFDSDILGFGVHHRLLDLSSIKLMYQAAGMEIPQITNPGAHRALYDCHEAASFARTVRDELISLVNA